MHPKIQRITEWKRKENKIDLFKIIVISSVLFTFLYTFNIHTWIWTINTEMVGKSGSYPVRIALLRLKFNNFYANIVEITKKLYL